MRRAWVWVWVWVAEHPWFAGVFVVGAGLRGLAMAGYRPALWFPDTYTYVVTALRPRPDLVRPAGYSMFLRLLEPLHSFAAVAFVQHVLGLATGLLVYTAARRLRAPAWASVLASTPVLLDAYQVELEHLLVSDTLFMFLVTAAVCLALPRVRGWRPACAVGLLLAAAALTRTAGLPLLAVMTAWVLLRRPAPATNTAINADMSSSAGADPGAETDTPPTGGAVRAGASKARALLTKAPRSRSIRTGAPKPRAGTLKPSTGDAEAQGTDHDRAPKPRTETLKPSTGDAGARGVGRDGAPKPRAGTLKSRAARAGVMLVAVLVPVLAYAGWFYATYQRIGIVGANGVFFYARAMSFADCARMRPPPDLAVLCDARPPAQRPPSQDYIWSADSPLVARPGITFTAETDALAGRFAALAIRTQPLDYAASVLTELGRTFTWGRPVYPDREIYELYEFPERPPPLPDRAPARVGAEFAARYEQGDITTRVAEPYAGWLRAYQDVVHLPGPALLAVLLAAPAAAAVRRGGAGWALPWAMAWVSLITPAAVAEFDYRYVLPAVPLACLAAALAVTDRQALITR